MKKKSIRVQREVNKKIKKSIKNGQDDIRDILTEEELTIYHRTQANNRKHSALTLDDEKACYEEPVKATLRAYGKMLPLLIANFSEMKDPRDTRKIKYQMATVMLSGLFLFIHRISSRRQFTKTMTLPSVFEHLKELFPELSNTPHAETIARMLNDMDVEEIQEAHVALVKTLIRSKKFRKLLINGCIPLSVDGTQKLTRDGELNDPAWLHRKFTTKNAVLHQQYAFVVEASITFSNGLHFPLLTEFLRLTDAHMDDKKLKQDTELKGFYRIIDALRCYFPRTKFMLLIDNLYANQYVCDELRRKKLHFMIKLPTKLKVLSGMLDEYREDAKPASNQKGYRERHQRFYFKNDVPFGDENLPPIHLVSCIETWSICNESTGGKIKPMLNEHRWISSFPLTLNNAHMLCNLAARKRAYIEDEFNTEKNRGYHYEHAYSYQWNAMKGFHYLMRLARVIQIMIEWLPTVKKMILKEGWSHTLSFIRLGTSALILSKSWFLNVAKLKPLLTLALTPTQI